MEEILASIRRIISEDEEDTGASKSGTPSGSAVGGRSAVAAAAVPEPEPEDDLSSDDGEPEAIAAEVEETAFADDQPEEDDTVSAIEPAFDRDDEPASVIEMAASDTAALDADDPVTDTEHTDPFDAAQERLATKDVEMIKSNAAAAVENEVDSYVDEEAASAASSAFQTLSRSVRVSDVDGPGKSLENLVTEMLRPMVKDWLDANLPRIVEEKVEEEVQRIARRR